MSILHAMQSAKAQGADATLVSKNQWNQQHVVDLSDEYTSALHVDLRRTCVGDGVANDTAAIAAALTACVNAGGGTIYVAANKVFLTDRITLNAAGITVRIKGPGEIRLRTAGNPLIQCSAGRIIIEQGVKLNGNGLALANTGLGLGYVVGATAYMEVYHCEVANAGIPASNVGNGLCSNSGGKLQALFNDIHDCMSYGIRIQANGKFDISHNEIHDCGNNGIYLGQNSNYVSDSGVVLGNEITNIRADGGGNGPNGNGIIAYNLDNVVIGPNIIKHVPFSFVRINSCSFGSITGVIGVDCHETGIYCELGANNYSITGCVIQDIDSWGISVVNLPSGVKNVVVSGCEVYGFGRNIGGRAAGITMEFGLATGNIIDGNNNSSATWGVSTAPGGLNSDTNSWQSRIADNDISGCKYDIGVAGGFSGGTGTGTQRMIITGNNHIRSDANYAGPIGAIGGGVSDGGNGSAVSSAMRGKIFWDRNYWNVPTGQYPTSAEEGSEMKINGVWSRIATPGAVWTPI